MTNAFYFMQLSVTLTAALTADELDELRWHLRIGPRPQRSLQVDGSFRFFYFTGSSRGEGCGVELSQIDDGRWALTAAQEPSPDDVDQAEPLFRWLAAKSDPSVVNPDGSVLLGRLRFYDESDWTNGLLIHRDQLHYPRIHKRPASESMTDAEAVVTTWNDFASRLELTLGRIRGGDWIRLGTTGNRHACFFGDSNDETVCNIVSNDYLDDDFLMSDDEEAGMRRLGWDGPSDGYWIRRLLHPATTNQLHSAAEASMLAFRDLLDVASPQELLLSAFSEHPGEQPDTTAMGMNLSPWP
ncbi:hypothetical protein GFY24_04370 [Nocardia sp. SYP-A9097]|uniref:TY-Chap domain-containing protein n=1 Tax=Nocardia sp. SYP-A9097 TaxID=2663237 RepID=UPI00129A50B1|nr:hypothetical protein [Nocardia sp. SYP-A9097]MRH86710.1 hypothetical protein [Nocardia sp. SYP-A9097]